MSYVSSKFNEDAYDGLLDRDQGENESLNYYSVRVISGDDVSFVRFGAVKFKDLSE